MKRRRIIIKILRDWVAPLILLMFALGMSVYVIFTYKLGLTVLPYVHSTHYNITPDTGKLLKGHIIHGEFIANENNLGAIALRLHNYTGAKGNNEDRVRFEIKEINAKHWYYQHDYRGTQFYELDLFPFGFPLIPNSKGKTYIFTLESLKGTKRNAVTLLNKSPNLVSEYQFSKNDLKSDKNLIAELFINKLNYAMQNPVFGFTFLVYFLPLIVYFLLLPKIDQITVINISYQYINLLKNIRMVDKSTQKIGIPFATLILFIAILADIFIIDYISSLTVFIVVIIWTAFYLKYKFNMNISFFLVLFLLFFCPVFFLFGFSFIAQKMALWAYVFLFFGTAQMGYELVKFRIEK